MPDTSKTQDMAIPIPDYAVPLAKTQRRYKYKCVWQKDYTGFK